MAELAQVTHGERRALAVLGHDEAGPRPAEVGVDRDARQLGRGELLDLRVAAVEAHHDRAVDAVMAGAAEIRVGAAEAVAGLVAREQQQVEPEPARAVLEADEHFLEERMQQVRVAGAGLEDHADDVRAAADERPRRRARRVVELAGELQDPAAGGLADLRRAVQRPRDGGHRDAGFRRQLLNGRHFRKRFRNKMGASVNVSERLVKASQPRAKETSSLRSSPPLTVCSSTVPIPRA